MLKVTRIDRTEADKDRTHDLYVNRALYFAGEVNLQRLVGRDESGEVELLAVFFAAGARTRPHTHDRDQVLHYVEGRGIVATASEKVHSIAGEVVTIPAGEWHWHGAAKDAAACHISIRQPGSTNWDVDAGNWAAGYDD